MDEEKESRKRNNVEREMNQETAGRKDGLLVSGICGAPCEGGEKSW